LSLVIQQCHFCFGPAASLSKCAVIAARRLTCDLPEYGRKRAGLAKANGQTDFRYRMLSLGQHQLRSLDASVGVVSMRRNAERLLECPAKMKRAQSRQARPYAE